MITLDFLQRIKELTADHCIEVKLVKIVIKLWNTVGYLIRNSSDV